MRRSFFTFKKATQRRSSVRVGFFASGKFSKSHLLFSKKKMKGEGFLWFSQ